jgi:hypothetical protein
MFVDAIAILSKALNNLYLPCNHPCTLNDTQSVPKFIKEAIAIATARGKRAEFD